LIPRIEVLLSRSSCEREEEDAGLRLEVVGAFTAWQVSGMMQESDTG
jgi:hypothetical protein